MKIYFILVLILCIFSCKGQNFKKESNKSQQIKSVSKVYVNCKKKFPAKFVQHFPKEFGTTSKRYDAYFSSDFGQPFYLGLVEQESTSNIEKKIKEYRENSIAHYVANDTCLFLINRFAKENNYDTIILSDLERKLINKNCYSVKYPIPKFSIYDFNQDNKLLWQFKKGENNTECRLPESYVVYVLESKQGKYMNDSLLSKYEFMPKNWEHGFSRGVVIGKDDNIIIYWLSIW